MSSVRLAWLVALCVRVWLAAREAGRPRRDEIRMLRLSPRRTSSHFFKDRRRHRQRRACSGGRQRRSRVRPNWRRRVSHGALFQASGRAAAGRAGKGPGDPWPAALARSRGRELVAALSWNVTVALAGRAANQLPRSGARGLCCIPRAGKLGARRHHANFVSISCAFLGWMVI